MFLCIQDLHIGQLLGEKLFLPITLLRLRFLKYNVRNLVVPNGDG